MSVEIEPSTTRWWRPVERSDRWALAWMLVIPIVLFVLPAFAGRPAIDADNLLQNFPLRVLAGHQLASGHLPLLNPLSDAGTPLLGGMNAGALYPLSLLFAFVPAIAAWLINLIAIYVTAALGLFALLRWHGLRTWPSFAAALTYTYSGAMIGQMVHIGVVQGFSFIPWLTLAMLALSRRLSKVHAKVTWSELARISLPWACGVASLWGLTFLTGEPRAIAELELLTIIVVPAVLLLRTSYWLASWRARVAYLVSLLVGFVWGVGLGLVQLLPGWSFITYSQRSQVSYAFFGAGSLAVRWSALFFSPDIFGGNGAFGEPSYFVNYNLTEVTGYVGVLALMAVFAFFARFTARGWRDGERDFTLYVVVIVIGLLATWGSFTPLGHVFRAIPLFGSTRLQSRNVILVDLGLSILLGWWLQRVQDNERERAGLGVRSRWVTLAPVIVVTLSSLAFIVWGAKMISYLGVPPGTAHFASRLELSNALHLAIGLFVIAAMLWRRFATRRFRILVAVLFLDLMVFIVFTASGVIGGTGPREPASASAVALFGTTGRFALVDPTGLHSEAFRALGQTDMNVFTGLASVQGYGALISKVYNDATGTQPQAMVDPCQLGKGTFSQLRLSTIAIAATALSTNPTANAAPLSNCVANTIQPSLRRYFGQLLNVRTIVLRGVGARQISTGPLYLQLLSADGRPIGPNVDVAAVGARKSVVGFNPTRASAGFMLSSSSGVQVGDTLVTTGGGKNYSLNTDFQLAIGSSSWRLKSTENVFSVFAATSVLPVAWLTSPTSNDRVTKIQTSSWGDSWVSVSLSSSRVLYRSMAYLPGWRATAHNLTTGREVLLVVHRAGLIQSIRVPAGQWSVHFHYRAPYIEVSLVTSVASTLLLVLVVGRIARRSRRNRNDKVLS